LPATDIAMRLADTLMAVTPRHKPSPERLSACRIVSHRGEHDNVNVFENTLPAFRQAADAGVWGLECDIRWTRDDVPVICHDVDGRRVFGKAVAVADHDFHTLRDELPLVPSLAEVLQAFGGRHHLMLEIKDIGEPLTAARKAVLGELLAPYQAGSDFHMLALEPELFDAVDFLPREACFPVAELHVSRLSRAALDKSFGGLTGHFLLLNDVLKARHEGAGQRIGVGFIRSRNSLYRELNRGIDWIFSNDAVKLQAIIHEALSQE